jgi:hypothetical protein
VGHDDRTHDHERREGQPQSQVDALIALEAAVDHLQGNRNG